MLTRDSKVDIYQNAVNDYFIRDMYNEVNYICWADEDNIRRGNMSKDEWEDAYNGTYESEFIGNMRIKDFFGKDIEIIDDADEE